METLIISIVNVFNPLHVMEEISNNMPHYFSEKNETNVVHIGY